MNAITTPNPYAWPAAPPVLHGKAWDDLFVWAHRCEMSDLHVQTNRPVKMVVHGRFHDVMPRAITAEEVNSAAHLLYGPTALAHLKKAQDFDIAHVVQPPGGERYRIGEGSGLPLAPSQERYRFRVNGTSIMTNGADGVQLTLRRIENDPPLLASMDIEAPILRAYRPRNGLVLICGAVGTGKTRTLAGMVRSLLEDPGFHGKIIEFALPLEYEFDRINSRGLYSPSEVPRHMHDVLAGMRGALRRGFHVMLSPECRDRETMQVAMGAAQTGAAVYSTLHTNSVVETIQRILGMFPRDEREDRAISLAQSLRLIVNCLLVPSTDGRRVQLREFVVVGPQEREALLDTPVSQWPGLTRRLVAEKGQTFAAAATHALRAGLISEDTAATLLEDF